MSDADLESKKSSQCRLHNLNTIFDNVQALGLMQMRCICEMQAGETSHCLLCISVRSSSRSPGRSLDFNRSSKSDAEAHGAIICALVRGHAVRLAWGAA